MKMNGKKPSKFKFHFPRVLVACLMLKKNGVFFVLKWLAEIIQFMGYPIKIDRTEMSDFLFTLSNFAIKFYGHFSTRNGLKLRLL